MSRRRTILDCYTDEPAGLGVPPYLGVWPRYAAGQYRDEPTYLTIDDLRLANWKGKVTGATVDPPGGRTRIELVNHTRRQEEIDQILNDTDQLTIVAGVHTPGKYLSGAPGTLPEILRLLGGHKFRKILTGPIVVGGTQVRGGAAAEIPQLEHFDAIRELGFDDYQDLQPVALKGAGILGQIPHERIIEIETGMGCTRETGCSFCTEPIKHELRWRRAEDVVEEVKTFMDLGATVFRLGKQSCIFSYQNGDLQKLESLLEGLSRLAPSVLHIDNANPVMVTEDHTKLFVKYLTPGSTAAMGIESFDPKVQKLNNLNCTKESAFEAIRIVNRIGGERSETGCPYLLPGINILLGLEGESPGTLEENYEALKQLLDDGLLVRRINIRQVVPFAGTALFERVGNKFLRKNRRLYSGWIEKVRHTIDFPMLERLFPEGTVLRCLRAEVHDGNVTFLRQVGSYPIIVGVRKRLPLGEFFDIRVTGHMLRSLCGEVIS
ncbi:MAG: radical SAM protein [Planctomycetota bacterium]|jgi:radical SAM superfamily enzyme with C-terminal helix-hairpin-helix motif